MKTAREILNNDYYKELHSGNSFDICNYNRELIIESMKEYAIEVAKEALRNGSENAKLVDNDGDLFDRFFDSGINNFCFVHKDSILDENNIPKI